MQSKPAYARIQDGGERHLENQLYVITTILWFDFVQILTIPLAPKMQSKTGQAEIQDGGGRHLENQLYVITTVFMVRFCSNFQHSSVPSSCVRKCN
jgi:hypothetical protein